MNEKEQLIAQLDKLHTTELGVKRLRKNLSLDEINVVDWCRQCILNVHSTCIRKGKNYYVWYENCCITINAYSFTIITGHQHKSTQEVMDEETTLKLLTSTINNCESMQKKFALGSSQHTLLVNRIKALKIAKMLFQKEDVRICYTEAELIAAIAPLDSVVHKCEKALSHMDVKTVAGKRTKNMVIVIKQAKQLLKNELEAS